MSSGQWEVVGKSKKTQNGKVKSSKDDEKKDQKNGPKLEDSVTNSQIKTFYSGMEIDEAKKPAKKIGDKKPGKKSDKKTETKPKPPKTIEAALEVIDVAELASVITSNKLRFSNAPLVWLKEVANFLNTKILIEVDDPSFPNYPLNYPSNVTPAEVKKLLNGVIQDAGKANAQLFFDITLTSLANDMSRGQLVNGHRLLLQLLAQSYPEFCVASISKSVSLRNSYQNRPPIGLTLLWAYGQGGLKDFDTGLQVWQELFLPIIELKNYTKYIITYFAAMLDQHISSKAAKLSQDKLLALFDAVNTKKNGLSKEQTTELMSQLVKVKDIYFASSTNKLQVLFNQLMKKLPNQYLSAATLDPYNRVVLQCLVDCLARDDSCNATWRQLFHRCSKQSATFLDFIDSNWSEVSTKLKQKSLKATVMQYKEICGETLRGKKKDETVEKTNKICQDILDRMTSSRRFPWLWASFFLLVGIAGLVTYDMSRVGGNFPKSATGKLLNDLGVLEQSQRAWQKTLSTSARSYLWLETNAPVYYVTAVEFSRPYAQLAADAAVVGAQKAALLFTNVKEYVIDTTPVVVAKIEEYAPGLVDNVQSYTVSGWTTVKKYSGDYYGYSAEYLKTKVFVGDWAPEILQNRTQTALNATRNHVTTYYSWFRQQVNVYSEIP